MPGPTSAPPEKRRRGRPARLSRERIIEAAVALLDSRSLEELSVQSVAEVLGASKMSLYHYFPNRDELFYAVAEQAFATFETPAPAGGWDEQLLNWLRALQQHCDRHPYIFKVLGMESRLQSSFLQATMPLNRILKQRGFSGRALAFASTWLVCNAMAIIKEEQEATPYRRSFLPDQLRMPAEDRQIMLEILTHLPSIERQEILEFSFRELIAGLEKLARA